MRIHLIKRWLKNHKKTNLHEITLILMLSLFISLIPIQIKFIAQFKMFAQFKEKIEFFTYLLQFLAVSGALLFLYSRPKTPGPNSTAKPENKYKLDDPEETLIGYHHHLEKLVQVRTAEIINLNEKLLNEIEEQKRTEAELQKSEKRYRDLFNLIPIGFFRTNLAGQISEVNQTLVDWSGYPDKETLLKVNVVNLYYDDTNRNILLNFLNTNDYVSNYEVQLRRFDNKPVWVKINVKRIIDSETNQIFIEGAIEEITRQKETLSALEESERRFRIMAENIQDGLAIIENKRVVYLNNRACEIFGYPRSELMQLTTIDIAAPEEKERLIQTIKNIQTRKTQPGDLEFWIIQKDGTRKYIRNRYSAIMNKNGIQTRYVITTDMTQRRQFEMALSASEERYRIISELASDFAFSIRINADGKLSAEWVTDAFQKITGYQFEEALEQIGLDKIVHPEDLILLQNEFKKLLSGNSLIIEYRIFNKFGRIQWIQNYIKPIWDETESRVTHLYGAARDITHRKKIERKLQRYHSRLKKLVTIRTKALNSSNLQLKEEITERKKIEADLREAHARLNATLDALPDLMFEIDQEGRFYDFHSSNFSILYTPPDIFIGRTIQEILPEAVNQVILPAIQETLATGRHVGATYPLKTPIGECWFELSMVLKETHAAASQHLIVLARDITARKQAEEALKIKDAAIESALNGLILMDMSGNITYANPSFLKYWGFEKKEEVLGVSMLNFWENRNQAQAAYQSLVAKGNWLGELRARRKDNSGFDAWVATSIIYHKDQQPIHLIASFIDITRQKLLQAQLIRSEQLAATGQLAASVAHEINSPLQAVTLLLNVLRQKLLPYPDLLENIELLETAYGNIRDTVRNLLDLSRPGQASYQLIELNPIIKNLSSLLKKYINEHGIQLELRLAK
ncbi:PAS domain S-box protein, partial [candidate division KSB1 bacterium]|nr:PAS domain S-box protein [candidate division KSB1 bacterium]